jgi:hypothetical protein
MLIEFTVGNFCSFKEPATLSMVAANVHARDRQIDENNTFKATKSLTLLKSASIYGANASGKSNLVDAFSFMCSFVERSSQESQSDEPIRVTPFLFSTATETEPALFQVKMLINGIQYRYGFEVDRSKVIAEWLFSVPSTKEAKLFIRNRQDIVVTRKFKEGQGLETKTRPNALFLSVVAQFNGEVASKVIQWFRRLGIITGLNDRGYRTFTIKKFADGQLRDQIIQLVKDLDLGIQDVISQEGPMSVEQVPSGIPDDLRKIIEKYTDKNNVAIQAVHKKWDSEGNPSSIQALDLEKESEGTQKIFYLAGPIVDTLSNGRVLIIDEMEARLHPLMTQAIVGLFNSNQTNPNNAQIIFTTHDTNLLTNKKFRRDQIWFIEKDRQGASHLYSLAELKVRNDASFEDDYIEGRYGSIPFLGNIRQIFIENGENHEG